jgi:uncharacterized protein YecE (DUF72 family)
MTHPIRVGIGGWKFEDWDASFYPSGLSAKRQLAYASRKLTAIEVNATYYGSFKPSVFEGWAAEAPAGFVFSLKAHRFCMVRKTRDDMIKSVGMFLESGITSLKDKLGPINWQFPATRKFEAAYFDTFLSVLPKEKDKQRLRHVLEVRGAGFDTPEFYDLLSKHGATVVYADDEEFPKLRHAGADFAVARMMRSRPDEETGYAAAEISAFAKLYKGWSAKQDVFAFFISGAKARNPAAAMALQDALGVTPPTAAEADALANSGKAAPKAAAGSAAKTAAKSVTTAKKSTAKKPVAVKAAKVPAGKK